MTKYRVIIDAALTEYYCYDEIIEANSEEEAEEKALEDFNYDISPYATDANDMTYLGCDVIEEE